MRYANKQIFAGLAGHNFAWLFYLILILAAPILSYAQQPQTECPPECVTDTLEFVTYYPSPYGLYEELRGDKIIVGDTAGSAIGQTESALPPSGTLTFEPKSSAEIATGTYYEGSIYYDENDQEFKYYKDSAWQPLGGGGTYWDILSGNDIYNTNTGNIKTSGNMGIGLGASDTIGAKLQVNQGSKVALSIYGRSAKGIGAVTFSAVGSHTYKVPTGVVKITITACGAQGGVGVGWVGSSRAQGGLGAKVVSEVPVTSGEMLTINVGGVGGGSGSPPSNWWLGHNGGFNGGGSGGGTGCMGGPGGSLCGGGGGGGGASNILSGSLTLIVAGGGGGGGGGSGYGGNGGSSNVAGSSGSGTNAGAGGDAGISSSSSGNGGTGGGYSDPPGGAGGGGGGGGGGYRGGGGGGGGFCSGGGGGGGGGTSFVINTGTATTIINSYKSGDGQVIITPTVYTTENITEWKDGDGAILDAIDINGNLALGSSTANGYKLYVNGSAYTTGSTWATSDLRFKENILPLNNSLDKILNIQPVSFDWNKANFPDMNFEQNRQIGLVAQEVEKQIPELVRTDANGYKSIAYDKLIVVTIEAVKEQQKEIKQLKEALQAQEERNQEKLRKQQKEIELLKAGKKER